MKDKKKFIEVALSLNASNVANAAWVESCAEENDFNPHTSVHCVIQHLKSVAHSASAA